ncbi:hypothetical protein O1L60_01135 [Streptomyces diastatochromogenes]|nr:hypothetical protein [Streptomyces diastatochromogenes]
MVPEAQETVPALIARRAALTPGAPALITDEETVGYGRSTPAPRHWPPAWEPPACAAATPSASSSNAACPWW